MYAKINAFHVANKVYVIILFNSNDQYDSLTNIFSEMLLFVSAGKYCQTTHAPTPLRYCQPKGGQ